MHEETKGEALTTLQGEQRNDQYRKTDLNITERNRASGNERKTTNGTAEREGETREEGQACKGRR